MEFAEGRSQHAAVMEVTNDKGRGDADKGFIVKRKIFGMRRLKQSPGISLQLPRRRGYHFLGEINANNVGAVSDQLLRQVAGPGPDVEDARARRKKLDGLAPPKNVQSQAA